MAREQYFFTVQVHVLTSGELRIEAHAKFDERHQFARNGDRTVLREVDLRNQFQQRGLAAAVTADDAEELALMHLEADVFEHFLLLVALDALGPVDERLLQTGGLLRRQFEAFGYVACREHHRIFRIVDLLDHFLIGHHMTSANLRLLRRNR